MKTTSNLPGTRWTASTRAARPPKSLVWPANRVASRHSSFLAVYWCRSAAGIFATLLLLLLHANRAAAQGPLTNGWAHTGNISPAGDSDSWTFTANAGDSIVVRAGELFNTIFAPKLQILSPTSVLLASTTTSVGAEVAVVATNSGTFTVVVTDNAGTQTNAYRLTLAKTGDAVVVTPGDEGGPLSNGVMHTGTIAAGDLDVWTVTATAGQSLVVRMGETSNVTLNPQVRIYGPSGALLGNVETAIGAEVAVMATNSGTFLVVAGDYAASWSGSGAYRLTLAKTGDAVVVTPGDEGGSMTNGVMHTGTIAVGDLDVWTVTATAGESLVVRMGETSNVTLNPQVRIYGPSGALLGNVETAIGAEVAVTATNSGTFLVVAGDYAASWSGSGAYRLTLAKTGDAVVVSPGDEGGPLTNGVMHTGTIDVGDLDVWTVTATAGQSLVVRMGETSNVTLNPQVRIYGPSGALLGNVETAIGAEVAVMATNSGTFLVVAGDYAASWSGSGAYRLTLAKTGDAVVVSAGDEGGPMTNGLMHTGTIGVGDLDVWTVTATAGQSLVVRMGETSNVTLNPQVRIYGPNGALLGNVETAIGAEVAVTATNSGTFLVVAGDYAASWSGSGAYRLTLAKTGEPAAIAAGDDGGPMNGDGFYLGTLGVGDLDVWTFTACPGETIFLRMEETVGGSLLTPQLRLFGRDGSLLNTASGTGVAQINRTAPAGGSYTVMAGDFSASWSGSGGFTLTVSGLSDGLKLCVPTFSGTNVNVAGIGGVTNATFILFTHTNVATPLAQWMPIRTNQFDQFGVFNQTNVAGRSEPQRYFRLLEP